MRSLEDLTRSDLYDFCCEGLSYRTVSKIELGLSEHVCPVCGKTYSRTSQHAWKIGTYRKQIYFCSYSCMRRFQLRKEERDRIKEEKAIDRDLEIISKEDRDDLTTEEKAEIRKAKARLENAMRKKGILL